MKKNLAITVTILALCVIAHQTRAASNYTPTISGADAFTKLLDGNQRYSQGHPEHPNQSVERRTDLANGQHPFATVLGCSDSRVPPELVFDQGLGDLFVVRLAGNVADTVAIESIDYSVQHLGVRLIMVLGHDKCGAVTAAVVGHDEPGDVGPMLRELRPAVAASRNMPGDRDRERGSRKCHSYGPETQQLQGTERDGQKRRSENRWWHLPSCDRQGRDPNARPRWRTGALRHPGQNNAR